MRAVLSSSAKRRCRRRKHEQRLKLLASSSGGGGGSYSVGHRNHSHHSPSGSSSTTSGTSSSSSSRKEVMIHHTTTTSATHATFLDEPLPLMSQQSIWTTLSSDRCRPWCDAPSGITQLIAAYANPLHLCVLGMAAFLFDEKETSLRPLKPASYYPVLERLLLSLDAVQHHSRFLGFDMALDSWGTLPLPTDEATWYRPGLYLYGTSLCEAFRLCSGNSTQSNFLPTGTCLFSVQSGHRTFVFHPFTHEWKTLSPLKVERHNALVVNLDNCLYCIGGRSNGRRSITHPTCLVLSVCPAHAFHSPARHATKPATSQPRRESSSRPPPSSTQAACYDDSEEFELSVMAAEKALRDGEIAKDEWLHNREASKGMWEKELASNVVMSCGRWSTLAPMKYRRWRAGGVACAGLGSRGSILVFGGHLDDTCERYDIGTNTWTLLASMPWTMAWPHATLVSLVNNNATTSIKTSRDDDPKARTDNDNDNDVKSSETVVLVFDLARRKHRQEPRDVFAYHVATDRWTLLPWQIPPCTYILTTANNVDQMFVLDSYNGNLWTANVSHLDKVEWRLIKVSMPFQMSS